MPHCSAHYLRGPLKGFRPGYQRSAPGGTSGLDREAGGDRGSCPQPGKLPIRCNASLLSEPPRGELVLRVQTKRYSCSGRALDGAIVMGPLPASGLFGVATRTRGRADVGGLASTRHRRDRKCQAECKCRAEASRGGRAGGEHGRMVSQNAGSLRTRRTSALGSSRDLAVLVLRAG